MTDRSIVEYFSGHEGYRCGYCKSDDTCYSHGMWAHLLTPLDYQYLIDRGWRRSGKYCYKPTMHLTCCPQYTIRCEAKKFTLSRSQKKVLKKVRKFLANGEKEMSVQKESDSMEVQVMEVNEIPHMNVQNLKNIKNIVDAKQSDVQNVESEIRAEVDEEAPCLVPSNVNSSHVLNNASSEFTSNVDPSKPLCRKAKEIRRERKLQKLMAKGLASEDAKSLLKKTSNHPKSLEDFLFEPFATEQAYKLELRLVRADFDSDEFMSTFEKSYNVYKKYQMTIHEDTEEECNLSSFEDFLVETPLKFDEGICAGSAFGSFHQQYWLDDKLIAVGVIDILPYCVSSVYFYYDPDYSFLSLGTYAALREIAFIRELSTKYPDLQYYYMGFYIHSCIKMKYKGQYFPSYLLCPETYIFQPIEKCKPKLDDSKYHCLEEDPNKRDEDGIVILEDVLILYNKRQMSYLVYKSLKKNAKDEDIVQEYARFVGRKCYRRMLLYRN